MYVGIFITLAIIICCFFCYRYGDIFLKYFYKIFHDTERKHPDYKKAEEALLDFIEINMTGEEDGIISFIKNHKPVNEVLSESVGFFMQYCVKRNRKDMFDRQLAFLKKRMLVDGKFIKWKTGDEEGTCNTVIDDFRIVRALLEAYDKWQDKEYYNLAGCIQQGIYETQVEDFKLYEFYDWKSNSSRKNIPLSHIDLYAFDKLRHFNNDWSLLADRMLPVITGGRFGNFSIFFFKYYDYADGKYLADEEYSRYRGICLKYTLYTVIHLAEFDQDTKSFAQWLKDEINKGKLYAWYNPDTLKPSNRIESTSVYALAAIYAKSIGENDLYYKLIDSMLNLMIKNENSPYYGGFGSEKKGKFCSFDNLTALYALSLRDENRKH